MGSYDVPSFFAADGGIYGRYNATALFCYGLGIAVQVPFLATDPYTGSIAAALGGVDISWLVALAVVGPLYYVLARRAGPRSLGEQFGCRRVSGISFHDLSAASVVPPSLFKRAVPDLTEFLNRAQPIIEAVRREGDSALQRFARLYDGVTAANMSLRAEESEFAAAASQVPTEVIGAIKHAVDNIRRFHEAQKPAEMWLKEIQPGVWAGERQVPLDSVACYVPRGKGAFPSVLNMTAIPAMVAGVPRTIVITPPGPDGRVDPATLVAAQHVGITEVYKCGGAQGVAAVAYGTESVPQCLKIVGPGSPWVLAAKQLLSHLIDPGIPAGPSESIILADETADGALAALDLLIEAEHGPDSSAFLVTNSHRVAAAALRGAADLLAADGCETR